MTAATPGTPRSQRGKRFYEGQIPSILDQIPTVPGGPPGTQATGSWAYFLRPDGATIPEVLTLYPNGGIPEIDDSRMRERFGINAEYYRARQRAKGFTYLGSTLTEEGVALMVKVLAGNREDEILYCEDEIANCDHEIANNDRPEYRDQARRRRAQFGRRLEMLRQPFDPDQLIADLNDVARAQMLASVDPNVLRVMKAMVGDVNDRLAGMVAHFQGRTAAPDPDGISRPHRGPGRPRRLTEDFVDADPA